MTLISIHSTGALRGNEARLMEDGFGVAGLNHSRWISSDGSTRYSEGCVSIYGGWHCKVLVNRSGNTGLQARLLYGRRAFVDFDERRRT